MGEGKKYKILCAALLKNKIASCQKRVFKASLTELTYSVTLKVFSCVQAVGGQSVRKNVFVMAYITEPTWFSAVY